MLGALIRVGASYASRVAFFRKWKNTFLISGCLLLCVVAVIFIDMRMYLTAGLVGLLATAAVIALTMHHFKWRRYIQERARYKLEEAASRAAAAKVRSEKISNVRASAAEIARDVGGKAAGIASSATEMAKGMGGNAAGLAKEGYSGARERLSSWRNKKE